MGRIYCTILLLFIVLIIGVLFLPYQNKHEYFEDIAKTKAEECEDRYNELVKKKEAEDTSIKDAQAAASKQQDLIDAAKDAEWKDKVSKVDAQLKSVMAQQKEAEDKLADVNQRKADCEGKLAGVDPSIKNARECCDREREGRDKAVVEAAQSTAIANKFAAENQALLEKKLGYEAQVNRLQASLDSCSRSANDLQAQNASLRAQL